MIINDSRHEKEGTNKTYDNKLLFPTPEFYLDLNNLLFSSTYHFENDQNFFIRFHELVPTSKYIVSFF